MGFWDDALDFAKDNALVGVPIVGGLLAGGATAKDVATKTGAAKAVKQKATGQSDSSGVGAGKSYDPDEMIDTYLPGLTPDQHAAVREELRGAEGGSGGAYHAAINQLASQHPTELGGHTKWGKAFGGPTQPGQLSPEAYQRILQMTKEYQQPFLDQIKTTSQGVASSLQKLLPSLPESYKGLIQAEIPAWQGMATELPAHIAAADPGMIANAYAQYYAPSSATQSGQNPISALLQGAQQNPQALR